MAHQRRIGGPGTEVNAFVRSLVRSVAASVIACGLTLAGAAHAQTLKMSGDVVKLDASNLQIRTGDGQMVSLRTRSRRSSPPPPCTTQHRPADRPDRHRGTFTLVSTVYCIAACVRCVAVTRPPKSTVVPSPLAKCSTPMAADVSTIGTPSFAAITSGTT